MTSAKRGVAAVPVSMLAMTALALAAACSRSEPVPVRAETGTPPPLVAEAPLEAGEVTVRRGDTLGGIGARFGFSLGDMVSANPGIDRDRLLVGQVIKLPEAEVAMRAAPVMSAAEVARVRKAYEAKPPPLSGDGFLVPVEGKLIASFGDKPDGSRNDGINIAAPAGTPVVAAENGVVVYAGDRIGGFGRMILLRHAQDFTTAYAHNSTLLVSAGDTVTRGQRIATVGETGAVDRPQMHFELREIRTAVDPTGLLEGWPATTTASRN